MRPWIVNGKTGSGFLGGEVISESPWTGFVGTDEEQGEVACEWLLLQRRDMVGAVLRKENHAVICVAVFFGRVARVKP